MAWPKRENMVRGALIYAAGDTAAALLTGQFLWQRVLGMALIGGTLYAWEIPAWFAWIERRTSGQAGWRNAVMRTGYALAYFNPLWIARHLLFLAVFRGRAGDIDGGLLWTGMVSFGVNIPISAGANFVIQNWVSLRFRFVASAAFSGLMAVYYAMSAVWFGGR